MEYKMMRVQINKTFGGYQVGQIVTVPSRKGVPDEKYWRDRLRDSKTDECISVVKETKPKSSRGSNSE